MKLSRRLNWVCHRLLIRLRIFLAVWCWSLVQLVLVNQRTLAALVDKINSERSQHIITIEDPIEFTHKSKKSVVVQREVHYDTYSFSAALRSSLRQDPDVVLIGEMRDLETISAAITIAELDTWCLQRCTRTPQHNQLIV